MPAKASVIQVEPELAEAFNAAPKLEQERVKAAMRAALRLVSPASSKAQRLSKAETELFLKINRNLSDEKQQRYDELTEKRLDGILTEAEHAELGELIKEVEQIWGERLWAVIELARLRNVSPEEMMKRSEFIPASHSSPTTDLRGSTNSHINTPKAKTAAIT
jgi:hypothetical protein